MKKKMLILVTTQTKAVHSGTEVAANGGERCLGPELRTLKGVSVALGAAGCAQTPWSLKPRLVTRLTQTPSTSQLP